ncbi:MAG: hypothetical protein BWK80_37790 [Desulfobacteraceae bacterium IS3]|nr:MAG: hypothetical protein BWK80_37790 [Desulfobacteraceae bacterium IS3]
MSVKKLLTDNFISPLGSDHFEITDYHTSSGLKFNCVTPELHEHDPARHLLREPDGDDSAGMFISPEGGISRSSFSETVNHRDQSNHSMFSDN